MRKRLFFMLLLSLALAASAGAQEDSTAVHSGFEILQGPFETGPDVTRACLTCHTEAARQIQETVHWTWVYTQPETGEVLGKLNVVNNFCVGVQSNEPRCTSCHVGYGWRDKTFDFTSEENVDCLVCHDTTGTYKKFPTAAGHPVYDEPKAFGGVEWPPVDLAMVAQNVGATSRQTCGACHFSGGGGDAVKHGDLDSSLIAPSRELDVHMDAEGLNFTCSTCHTAAAHQIAGSRYAMNAFDRHGIDVPGDDDFGRASCESCHGLTPHQALDVNVLDAHVDRVACQTCHIPAVGRGEATKMWWDWSQAGEKNDEGKPFTLTDENGYIIYDTKKGAFKWEANVMPAYVWFNGTVDYNLLGEPLDPSGTVIINALLGSADDPDSRIWPVKRFVGIQPFDSVNQTLLVPHLFPFDSEDKTAYWGGYDWDTAIKVGMEYIGMPYSGEYDFIQSEMYWPQTHTVAPAESALRCQACHVEDGGRLEGLVDLDDLVYESD